MKLMKRYFTYSRDKITSGDLSLHSEPPEVGLIKKVNRKVVLVGVTARANPT